MIKEGREFEVVDAKTGEDITRHVLTQIIVDEEARGSTMLPVNFLRQLIGLYGGSMQGMVPQYLEAAMDAFQRNQTVMRDAFGTNALADLAEEHGMFGEDRAYAQGETEAERNARRKWILARRWLLAAKVTAGPLTCCSRCVRGRDPGRANGCGDARDFSTCAGIRVRGVTSLPGASERASSTTAACAG